MWLPLFCLFWSFKYRRKWMCIHIHIRSYNFIMFVNRPTLFLFLLLLQEFILLQFCLYFYVVIHSASFVKRCTIIDVLIFRVYTVENIFSVITRSMYSIKPICKECSDILLKYIDSVRSSSYIQLIFPSMIKWVMNCKYLIICISNRLMPIRSVV